MVSVSSFHYLSYLILFVLLLYFLILLAFLVIRRREISRQARGRAPVFHQPFDDSSFTFDLTTTPEDIGESFLGNRRLLVPLLLLRIAAFLFLLIKGVVEPARSSGGGRLFNYYDSWTVLVALLFFLTAALTSALLLRHPPPPPAPLDNPNPSPTPAPLVWSLRPRLLATAARLLGEVAGASVLLVLLGETAGLSSPSPSPLLLPLALFLLLLTDLLLSSATIRLAQFPATAAFLFLYLLVIWPSVFTGAMAQWPYAALLATDSPRCFGRYLALFLALLLCHLAWAGLSKGKWRLVRLLRRRGGGRWGGAGEGEDEMIELMDLTHPHHLPSHPNANANPQERSGQGEEFFARPLDTPGNPNNPNTAPSPYSPYTATSPYSPYSPYSPSHTTARPRRGGGEGYGQRLLRGLYDEQTLQTIAETRRRLPRPPTAQQFADVDEDLLNLGGLEEAADN